MFMALVKAGGSLGGLFEFELEATTYEEAIEEAKYCFGNDLDHVEERS